jgi:hypothetical protein
MDIFDQLKAKGILEVRVGFDGADGDCETTYVRCYPDFQESEDGRETVPCEEKLQEALELLTWDLLCETPANFSDAGAFGQVVFNVEMGIIRVEVHERHIVTYIERFRWQDGRPENV